MVVASVLAAGCPTEDEDTNDVASVPGEASYGTVESDDGGWLTEEPDCTEATSGAEASTDDGARAIPEPEGHAELVD